MTLNPTAASTTAPASGSAPLSRPERPDWSIYVAAARQARTLSAQQAALNMGVTPQTWAGFEAGTRLRNGTRREVVPKDATLHRIADALALAPDERRRLIRLAHASKPPTTPWQARLKSARINARITQAEAARAAGVTTATYQEWERRDAGAPRRDNLRRLLAAFGWASEQIDDFMNSVPRDASPVRAPQQPSKPVGELPAWSRYLTEARIQRGLYLADVDERIGQQSVVRRFELGGWPRKDGRHSVPSHDWLTRVAQALELSPPETEHLFDLADMARIDVARQGPRPFLAELLHEARRAANLTAAQTDEANDLPTGTWGRFERGHVQIDATTLDRALDQLQIRRRLAEAARTALRNAR